MNKTKLDTKFLQKLSEIKHKCGLGVVRCENDSPKPVAFGLCVQKSMFLVQVLLSSAMFTLMLLPSVLS